MEHASRFRALLAELGLPHPEAAKILHVSLRTLHNWLSARHEVPYAAYKLLRLLRFMELPGQSWAGWHFSRGCLVTPEGRTISGKDGFWWSLLVRQARGFSQLYRENLMFKLERQAVQRVQSGAGVSVANPCPAAGLVPYRTTLESTNNSSQSDVIMTSWPTLYDFQPPLTLPQETMPATWVSASTPLSASPLMPTSGGPVEPLKVPSTPARPGLSLTALSGKQTRQQQVSRVRRPTGGNTPASNVSPAKPSARASGAQAPAQASASGGAA